MLPTKAEMLIIVAREQRVKQKRTHQKSIDSVALTEEKLVKERASTIIRHFRAYKTLSFKG